MCSLLIFLTLKKSLERGKGKLQLNILQLPEHCIAILLTTNFTDEKKITKEDFSETPHKLNKFWLKDKMQVYIDCGN